MIEHLTTATFDDFVATADQAVVEFGSPRCGRCQAFAPVFEALAEATPDVRFAAVNYEEEADLVDRFELSTTSVLVFKSGKLDANLPLPTSRESIELVLANRA